MKHIHLDLIRVTEAAAIDSSHFIGRGDKMGADKAATDAMVDRLNRIEFCGQVAFDYQLLSYQESQLYPR
jgi:fructose-1,6-bisphosphatase II